MFPVGSVIVIDRFHGRHGRPKRRWFIYFGTTEDNYHIICTTTSRTGYYAFGTRKTIPHIVFSNIPCFEVDSVLDVMGVYAIEDKRFINYSPYKRCELPKDLIRNCIHILTESDYVEAWIKNHLRSLLDSPFPSF